MRTAVVRWAESDPDMTGHTLRVPAEGESGYRHCFNDVEEVKDLTSVRDSK
jgi:hypothetical protein